MFHSVAQLESILRGQKFNMRARNYFAVVTGTANADDTIDTIRASERDFFKQSRLLQTGTLKARLSMDL